METTHLIIGGTTKSGTTSLFQYLNDHPGVCGSSMKETRFFLDAEYPLPSKYRCEDGMDRYFEYFSHNQGEPIFMEATPDYLYSFDTPRKIKEALPRVKLVFILREPKSRFISWFNFSKQIGKLQASASLLEYIEMQHLGNDRTPEQHLMALKHGNYSGYLNAFYKHFDPSDIFVCFFEDLEQNPSALMNQLAAFLAIDTAFYASYDFKKHNETVSVKNQKIHKLYIALTFRLRKLTHHKKGLHTMLKRIKKLLNPIYMMMNSKKLAAKRINSEEMTMLEQFYDKELEYFRRRYDQFQLQK
jgi:hypothetical protein